MNRRDLLRSVAAIGAGSLLPSGVERFSPSATRPGGAVPGRARNVIFFGYDGTGYEDFATARHFARRLHGRPLAFEEAITLGATGSIATHSLTSVVTDSAAASTAWATGRRIVNNAVAMLPDGRPLTTILGLARDRGMATGLVSSARITHATPAAWVARTTHRDLEDDIAAQYLAFGADVLLGGGSGPFEPGARADGRDLLAAFRTAGYATLATGADLARTNASRLLGTFTPAKRHLPYEIDRRHGDDTTPTLAALTRRALDVLEGAERGFVLQVEAGRPDHANHENDPGALVWEWMAADDALREVLDFAARRGDTLVIVTADHDTGAGGIYGHGEGYRRSTEAFEALGAVRTSLGALLERMRAAPAPSEVRDAVRLGLGFAPTADQVDRLVRLVRDGDREGHSSAHYGALNSLNFILSEIPSGEADRVNHAFGSGKHTAGMVPVAMIGPGVTATNLGIRDITEPFEWMCAALGVRHQNPAMTEAEALRVARSEAVSRAG